jgi:hypothetical protein
MTGIIMQYWKMLAVSVGFSQPEDLPIYGIDWVSVFVKGYT